MTTPDARERLAKVMTPDEAEAVIAAIDERIKAAQPSANTLAAIRRHVRSEFRDTVEVWREQENLGKGDPLVDPQAKIESLQRENAELKAALTVQQDISGARLGRLSENAAALAKLERENERLKTESAFHRDESSRIESELAATQEQNRAYSESIDAIVEAIGDIRLRDEKYSQCVRRIVAELAEANDQNCRLVAERDLYAEDAAAANGRAERLEASLRAVGRWCDAPEHASAECIVHAVAQMHAQLKSPQPPPAEKPTGDAGEPVCCCGHTLSQHAPSRNNLCEGGRCTVPRGDGHCYCTTFVRRVVVADNMRMMIESAVKDRKEIKELRTQLQQREGELKKAEDQYTDMVTRWETTRGERDSARAERDERTLQLNHVLKWIGMRDRYHEKELRERFDAKMAELAKEVG